MNLFGPLTKNCPKLDKNKRTVSRFSVLVVYKSTVSTVQKSNYVRCFNFFSECFYFAHLSPDISIKLTKLHFESWKKIVSNDFALFPKNDCRGIKQITVPNVIRIENSLDIC